VTGWQGQEQEIRVPTIVLLPTLKLPLIGLAPSQYAKKPTTKLDTVTAGL
jgi:hypothetical protein